MSSNENIVKLDIGGTLFKTSKSTLTKYYGMFNTMLKTRIPVAKDESGSIFIDRSSKHFDLILNFMRDGHVELPESLKEIKEIQKEAEYYLLGGLMELCHAEMMKRKPLVENVKFIETDAELFRIVSKNPTKTILVIYYHVGYGDMFVYPEGFDVTVFMKSYSHLLDIYFKPFKDTRQSLSSNPTNWRWSIFFLGRNNCGTPKAEGRPLKNLVLFMTQLEDFILKIL